MPQMTDAFPGTAEQLRSIAREMMDAVDDARESKTEPNRYLQAVSRYAFGAIGDVLFGEAFAKMEDDVYLLGTAFLMLTRDGWKRLSPEQVQMRPGNNLEISLMPYPGSTGHRATQIVARRSEHIDVETNRRFPSGALDDSTFAVLGSSRHHTIAAISPRPSYHMWHEQFIRYQRPDRQAR